MNSSELLTELTPKQKANIKYYLKMKNNPDFIEKQRLSSAKYYNKIKDDLNFKIQVSGQKKIYYKKIKDNNINDYFPNCL